MDSGFKAWQQLLGFSAAAMRSLGFFYLYSTGKAELNGVFAWRMLRSLRFYACRVG